MDLSGLLLDFLKKLLLNESNTKNDKYVNDLLSHLLRFTSAH